MSKNAVYMPRAACVFHFVAAVLNPVLKRVGVFADVEYELSASWSGDPTTFELWADGLTRKTVLDELEKTRSKHPDRVFRVEAILMFTSYSNSVR